MSAPACRPASRKQLTYLLGLINERAIGDIEIGETLSMDEARGLIGYALSKPKPPSAGLAPGFYRDGDEVYRVRHNVDRTGIYAARLKVHDEAYRTATWEHAPGMANLLSATDALTPDDAARLGRMHGLCVVCRKRFTDPFATKAGIDAGCRAKLEERS